MMQGPKPLAREGDRQLPHRVVTIGRALERRREKLGLSREEAASAIGVGRSTYSAYASDQRRLSPEVLRTLAIFLDVGLEEILELYGATCVAQARRVLVAKSPAGSMGVERASIRRARRSDDMTIVERVYFDAGARDDTREVVALAPREQDDPRGDTPSPGGEGADTLTENATDKKEKKVKRGKKAKKEKKGKKKDKKHKEHRPSGTKSDASKKRIKKEKSAKKASKKGR